MFRERSGWFSSSVPQVCQDFWTLEGGTVAGWRTADYLFSADAASPDTLRIFESKDYLWNKVTVFHSLFLCACDKRQSVTSVCIGHYVLPPASVQHEVRNVVGRFIWEHEDNQSVQSHKTFHTEDEYIKEGVCKYAEASVLCSYNETILNICWRTVSFVGLFTLGYLSMDNLQKYSGDLCDFHPVCFRCSNSKAHT
ncbi:Telomere repeats-binding bouquet formation protein 2 [Channa argus]|uniref:Telomere repeats-binding bouquet formation protein 2 n=1 Tax=Channa argus TaxID=215402 RepID=A0A6G1P8X9_CHAAH|nr:Telomere repeats-binding bouquet formation protein 2 [Channa argus]